MAYQPSAALLAAQAKTAARNPGFSTSFTPAAAPTQQAAPAPISATPDRAALAARNIASYQPGGSQAQPLPSIGSMAAPSLGAPAPQQNSGAAMTPQRAATLASNTAAATAAGRTLGAPAPIKMTTGGSTINPATGGVSNASPTAPTLPQVDPLAQYQTGVQSAAELYQKSLQLTPEEIAAQTEADNLTTSYRTGNQDIADRGEPMYDIIGSQQSLENRYLNAQEPINAKLARLQAQRIANTNASKFSLDRADTALADAKTEARQATLDKQAADTAATARKDQALQFALENNIDKPFFSHNGTVYRTSDLKLIGTPTEAAKLGVNADGSNVQKLVQQTEQQKLINVGEGDAIYDPNTGKFVYKNPKTFAPDAGSAKPNIVKVNGEDYVYDANGNLTKPNVPTGPTADKLEKAKGMVSIIDGLLGSSSLNAAVGPTDSKFPTLLGGTADFEAQFRNLQALLTIDSLSLLKGPMSDKDIQFLKESSSALNLGMSQDGFKRELQKIKDKLQGAINNPQLNTPGLSSDKKVYTESDGKRWNVEDPNNAIPLTNGGSVPTNAQASIGSAYPSPIALATAKTYPVGSVGGQCTTFLHGICQFPPIGDGKLEKYASVDKIGISASEWRGQPRVGDVIVTDENVTYGHTAMVNAILTLPDGTKVVQLTESNYKKDKNGNGIVTYTRTIPLNSSRIYGAIRPGLKSSIA